MLPHAAVMDLLVPAHSGDYSQSAHFISVKLTLEQGDD